MLSRRAFITTSAGGALSIALAGCDGTPSSGTSSATPSPTISTPTGSPILAATKIPQFRTELTVPVPMRRSRQTGGPAGAIDVYDISVRQVQQQVLPAGLPRTTILAFGPTGGRPSDFGTPAHTVEARRGTPVRIRWTNELIDHDGKGVPHPLPVDPTLHWANPAQEPGTMGRRTDSKPGYHGRSFVPPEKFHDARTQFTTYSGPVPVVAHVHGMEAVGDESDGYPESWFLPKGVDVPAGWARHGRWWEFFAAKAAKKYGVTWEEGTQVCEYPNVNRPSTLWFHDHTMGMTRLNVYAGLIGTYVLREGPKDTPVLDARTGKPAVLPTGTDSAQPGGRLEVPLLVQDRSFREDGSLYYPTSREVFDQYKGPYAPQSPIPPVWNPEFFGNTIVVNGAVWPTASFERRRYRMRVFNACGSRVLILDLGAIPGAKVWQIGNDSGYLPAPVDLRTQKGHLVLAPAERADLLVDLTDVREGRYVLPNLGPDEPYAGGEIGSFKGADAATTGRVMQLRVVAATSPDRTTPGEHLTLPPVPALPKETKVRKVALMEHQHKIDEKQSGPVMAMLGTIDAHGATVRPTARTWMDAVTENPTPGATEVWEIYNFTQDAHPVHVHQVAFEILDRAPFSITGGTLTTGTRTPRKPGEAGRKDTVIATPGQVTRLRARFATAGQYVWHCHLLEHEDNEMMRPFRVGPVQPGQPKDDMPAGKGTPAAPMGGMTHGH